MRRSWIVPSQELGSCEVALKYFADLSKARDNLKTAKINRQKWHRGWINYLFYFFVIDIYAKAYLSSTSSVSYCDVFVFLIICPQSFIMISCVILSVEGVYGVWLLTTFTQSGIGCAWCMGMGYTRWHGIVYVPEEPGQSVWAKPLPPAGSCEPDYELNFQDLVGLGRGPLMSLFSMRSGGCLYCITSLWGIAVYTYVPGHWTVSAQPGGLRLFA